MQTIAVPNPQTDAEAIAVYHRAEKACLQAVQRTGFPHRALTTRLATLMGTVLDSDLNEADMNLVAAALQAAIDDRWHPAALEEALVAESEADRAEDAISDVRMIEPNCLLHIEAQAKAMDRQAVASRRASRSLWAVVRSLARTKATARQRVGLNGVAS